MKRLRLPFLLFGFALPLQIATGLGQEVGVWSGGSHYVAQVPASITNVAGFSPGGFHCLALKTDGTAVGWGNNRDGQASVPGEATNVLAVAAGGDHSLALRRDGTVIGWGRDWSGQASPPSTVKNVIMITAGWAHSVALRSDGTIVAWGNNDYGQTVVPVLATEVQAVDAGQFHTAALRTDGTVITWGWDIPTPAEATNVVEIAAGWEHTLALRRDGTVVAWGQDNFGQCTVPAEATNITAIAAGCYFSVGRRADGKLLVWGRESRWMQELRSSPADPSTFSAGEDFVVALSDDGPPAFGPQPEVISAAAFGQAVLAPIVRSAGPTSFQWYRNGVVIAGATNRALLIVGLSANHAGTYILEAANSQGSTFSPPTILEVTPVPQSIVSVGGWGNNIYDQLFTPAAAQFPIAISAGAYHVLALNENGTVVAWGKNRDGQTNVPPTATNVLSVVAGGDHSLALRADGSVVGWGRNWDGQAAPPAESANTTQISAGWAHSLALRADGTVVAWGNNDYGQTSVPALPLPAMAIAGGYYHSLALLTDGRVVSWGLHDPVPEAVSNAVAIAAGWSHSLAVLADGTVAAWGDNRYGQCDVPPSATNVVAVSAGWWHSVALRADGTVVAWGAPYQAVLQVPAGLRNVSAIVAGEEFCYALVTVGPPTTVREPMDVRVHVGGGARFVAQASGPGPLTYQWYRDGVAVPGATNRFLRLTNVRVEDAGAYTMKARNNAGDTTTRAATLAVAEAPLVVVENRQHQVLPGGKLCLSAEASGTVPLAIQWRSKGVSLVDGIRISGAQTRMLCIDEAQFTDSGDYEIVVSNGHGSVTAAAGQVVVTPLIAWGDNTYGQATVPLEATNIVSVSAGDDHNLAVTGEGRILAWGDNSFGQCDVPADATNIVSAAAGRTFSMAVRADGTAVVWGRDFLGGTMSLPKIPAPVAAVSADRDGVFLLTDGTAVTLTRWATLKGTNIVAVAPAEYTEFVLKSDGTLYRSTLRVGPTNIPIVAVSAVHLQALALQADGRIFSLGNGDPPPPDATNVVAIDAGGEHALAQRADGSVFGWGWNLLGQASIPSTVTNVIQLSAGESHSLALCAIPGAAAPSRHRSYTMDVERKLLLAASLSPRGSSYAWTFNGQPIPGATNSFLLFEHAQRSESGRYEVVAIDLSGREWRESFEVVVGPGIPFVNTEPEDRVGLFGSKLEIPVEVGGAEPLSFQWSMNGAPLADGPRLSGSTTAMLTIQPLRYEDVGTYGLRVWNAEGSLEQAILRLTVTPVLAWGSDLRGQAKVPSSATNVISVAAGDFHTLALRTDGTVVAWGDNTYGQTNVPLSAAGVVAIAAGWQRSVALRADGTAVSWGRISSSSPSGERFVGIRSYMNTAIGLRADGSVGWEADLPAGLSNVADLVYDHFGGHALRRDGTVVMWGSPRPLPITRDVSQIAGGPGGVIALLSDGTLAATGDALPIPNDATNVVAVTGWLKYLALRSDGTLVYWGADSAIKVFPQIEDRIVSVAAGLEHAVAIVDDTSRDFRVARRLRVHPGTPSVLVAPTLGAGSTAYQWKLDGQDLLGQTNAFLCLDNLKAGYTGNYTVHCQDAFRELSGLTTLLQVGAGFLALAGDGSNQLLYVGGSGLGPIVFETSTDLANWQTIRTNASSTETLQLDLPAAEEPRRFYRAYEQFPVRP